MLWKALEKQEITPILLRSRREMTCSAAVQHIINGINAAMGLPCRDAGRRHVTANPPIRVPLNATGEGNTTRKLVSLFGT